MEYLNEESCLAIVFLWRNVHVLWLIVWLQRMIFVGHKTLMHKSGCDYAANGYLTPLNQKKKTLTLAKVLCQFTNAEQLKMSTVAIAECFDCDAISRRIETIRLMWTS